MLFSVFYLSLFLSVGLLSARRAVPDGSAAVIVPLGCGFGVSLLAVLPALFAVVLGFTLPAAALAAAAAAGIGAALLYRGTRLRGMAKDPDSGALWACLLPVVLITLYLLHTHVLHLVDGAYHTGQSCYGDMPMHLGFIKYIAQSGEFLPRYPLLGGTHRFGYPFLCETVSSVFVVLGADLRTAYLLPMLPAFLSVYGMFWQLARRVTDSVGKACLAFYLFFMGSGLGFVYFLGSADSFAGIFTGFYTTPTNFVEKNIEWVNPIVDLLIPQRATLFGWCVLLPAVYLLWRFCYEGERRLWPWLAALVLPLPLLHTHSALALVLLCLVGGVYTLAQGPRQKTLLPWLGLAAVCGAAWLCQMLPTVLAQSLDGQHMLRLHFNWINGQDDGTLRDNYFWFYIKNIGLVYLLLIPAFLRAKPKQRWLYGAGGVRRVPAEQLRQQQAALCLAYSGLYFGCTAACGYFCRGARPALAGAGAGGMLLCGHVRQCADRRPRGAQRLPAVERGRYGAGGSHRRKRRERRAVSDKRQPFNTGVCAGRAADTLRVGQLCLLPRHGLFCRVQRHAGAV